MKKAEHALIVARLQLPASYTLAQISNFEMVFSELLDAAATSHLREADGKNADEGTWLIEAIFTAAPDPGIIADLLAPHFAVLGINPVAAMIVPLADRDWLAENRAAFPARQIGRFWVYGNHVKTLPPAASWPLLIEAAQAFGSGTHPTTEGCLRAFQAVLRHVPSHSSSKWRMLDMGCGSAILALAALRARPASQLVAADNDPIAVSTAAENRQVNAIARHSMRCVVSTGFGARPVRQQAPYDLIFANILAGPLCRMARDLVPCLGRGGWLILSGILNEQAGMVERRYMAHGAKRHSRICIGEWTILIMRPARLGAPRTVWHGHY